MGTAIPPGNCGVHGYHGRTSCPKCSTSALPFNQLIQSPPLVPDPATARPLDYATLKQAFDAIKNEPMRVHGTESDPHLVSADAVRDGQGFARCVSCLRIVRVAP